MVKWIKTAEKSPKESTACVGSDGVDLILLVYLDGAFRVRDHEGEYFPVPGITHWIPIPERTG